MSDTHIRPMRVTDAPACADIHMQSFENFFLTFLGKRFLSELYAAIASDPSGIAFVAENSRRLVGFVAGTVEISGFYKHLLRQHLLKFALASVQAFIRKPAILPRLLRAFTAPNEKETQPGAGRLMSLAVLPETQGQGVGKHLVSAFLADSARRGLRHVSLHTDYNDNTGANRFYQRAGFICVRTYRTPEGRRMNEYIIDLPPTQPETHPAGAQRAGQSHLSGSIPATGPASLLTPK